MDNEEKIKALEEKNAKLEEELQATKEHLKKYTAPSYKKANTFCVCPVLNLQGCKETIYFLYQ